MILFLFLPLELLLGPDHNLKSYSVILHFQTTKSHNFSIIRNLYHFFFPYSSVQGPTTQVGPIGLRHVLSTHPVCMHSRKTHEPYEQKIHSSWGRRCLVKHRKLLSNCVSGHLQYLYVNQQFIVNIWYILCMMIFMYYGYKRGKKHKAHCTPLQKSQRSSYNFGPTN